MVSYRIQRGKIKMGSDRIAKNDTIRSEPKITIRYDPIMLSPKNFSRLYIEHIFEKKGAHFSEIFFIDP